MQLKLIHYLCFILKTFTMKMSERLMHLHSFGFNINKDYDVLVVELIKAHKELLNELKRRDEHDFHESLLQITKYPN